MGVAQAFFDTHFLTIHTDREIRASHFVACKK